jgi:hypothetical protein
LAAQKRDAAVLLLDAADDFRCVIGGLVVQHNDLKGRMILRQQGLHASSDVGGFVAGRDQDGEERGPLLFWIRR